MKTPSFCLFSLLVFCYSAYGQNVVFNPDTIEINIQGELLPWVKKDSTYYCFFYRSYYGGHSDDFFYIINENTSAVIATPPLPEDLNKSYKDLFAYDKQIIVQDYYSDKTFRLNEESFQWEKIKKARDVIYEDNAYLVYSKDFGEWGGFTWFRNKRTKTEYGIDEFYTIVNRLDSGYVLTNSKGVILVKNPKELKIVPRRLRYKRIFRKDWVIADDEPWNQAVRILFEDTVNRFLSRFSIQTSFFLENDLFHLCRDSTYTYLATITNGRLHPAYVFKKPIYPFRWSNDDRYRISPHGYQTIQFRTGDPRVFGLIEIDSTSFRINYFKNHFEEPYLGVERTHDFFIDRIDSVTKGSQNLNEDAVEAMEAVFSSTNYTPRDFSFYPFDNYLKAPQKAPIMFSQVIDSTLKMKTTYWFHAKTDSLQSVSFSFHENDNDQKISIIEPSGKQQRRQQRYLEEWHWIIEMFTEKYGEPTVLNKEEDNSFHVEFFIENTVYIKGWLNNNGGYSDLYIRFYPLSNN